jgi:RNA polymerase sigma-70 factor (ECF subfamily)
VPAETASPPAQGDPAGALLGIYDRALPQVYGYLVTRCGSTPVAEDLTAETFLAAVEGIQKGTLTEPSTAWLVGVARHKLVDHWRRLARDERRLASLENEAGTEDDDPWDEHLDAAHAREVLAAMGAHHRAALTLRYVDGLPVRDVAEHLGRTEQATETLLMRAKRAFRTAYGDDVDGGASSHGR